MTNQTSTKALLLAMPLAAAMATGASAHDLTIVGFGGGYQDTAREHLFQAYAAHAGIAINDDVYNGEMARIYAMAETGDVTWDIVMVEAPEMVRGCEDGVFAPIDWDVVTEEKLIPAGV